VIKRGFDVVAAGSGLLILSPLMLLVALVIAIESPGGVLFRQRRIGRGFRPFTIYKFRSMAVNGAQCGPLITCGEDPRITRVGRCLRWSKIDELPQLVNVLKGEMSLVGPRPEVEEYVRKFQHDYAEILTVRPGLTDLASLKYRDEATVLSRVGDPLKEYVDRVLPEKIGLAKEYLRQASFLFDLLLIAKTLMSVVVPRQPELMSEGRMHWRLKGRRVMVIGIQAVLVALSNYAAFWLRFDGNLPLAEEIVFYRTIPWVIGIRTVMFVPFRLYEGLWRYAGIWDLLNIIKSVVLSTLLLFLVVHGFHGQWAFPRSVYIIDSVVLICLLGGIRLVRRFYRELLNSKNGKRLLIYGAGDAGEMIIRDMKRYAEYVPIGFIDDDPVKVGQRIHGVRVLGTRRALPRIMEREKPHEVLVALPDGDPSVIRSVVEALQPYKVPITTLPALRDILNGKFVVDQIRGLSIDDLLPRAPVGLNSAPVERLIAGKRVLITGAGGSIGSELSRQIAAFEPEAIILYERYENGLYDITNDLLDGATPVPVSPVIGDVTDRARLNAVMAEHRPQLVFHAAAHKHVPLMEQNPCEAVKNNVAGTRMVAEAAERNGVELFVLVSTDKAVNPSSVMGATKRVAELILQTMAGHGRTSFLTVRFGNVLGSNGSLVPRFLGQIKAGGPVTVTHPEIRRYFMLIPEAVQLVLHAAASGQNGGMYTLEMGDQIKVLDMARNLIRLSGFVPDEEIPIVFVGLRPGEKLSEELVGSDETIEESGVSKIFRVRGGWIPDRLFVEEEVTELERLASANQPLQMVSHLCRLLPSFRPEDVSSVSRSGGHEPGPILPRWADAGCRAHGRPARSAAVFVDRRDPNQPSQVPTGGGRRLTDIIGVPVDRDEPVGTAAKS